MSDLRGRVRRLEDHLGAPRSFDPTERPVGERVVLLSQGPGMTRADAVAHYVAHVRDPAMLGPGADVTQPETWFPEERRRPRIIVLIHDIPSAERPARGTARVIALDGGKLKEPEPSGSGT